ncbi:MAG: thioredoxin-dependent thiol peroxidase [Planctomycetes bacterium]|nr:thioredoxin-dependent thiol peroxidase [Planctomycetota bacterium]
MLRPGDPAPAFTLESTSGSKLTLSELRGKKVVLYFYPRDDTPGCTREACAFRDDQAALKKTGAVVLGVSRDTLASHAKFRAKYALPFELLSDPDFSVAKAYGAHGKKLMYGKPVVGSIRSTFLIDEQGKIARVWSPVKVDGHAAAVLAALTGVETDAPKAKAKRAPASKAAPAAKATPAAKVAKSAAKAKAPAKKKPAVKAR